MDAKRAEEKAKSLFGADALFCAESVLSAVADEAGIVSPLIPRIATGFCGGMARTRGACGAVTGGIMALGVLCGRDDARQAHDTAYDKVQKFIAAFEKAYTTIDCFELAGFDLGNAAQRRAFTEKGVMEKCRGFTGTAARLVVELVNGD